MCNLMQPLDILNQDCFRLIKLVILHSAFIFISLFVNLFFAGFEPFGDHDVNASWVAVQVWICKILLEFIISGTHCCYFMVCSQELERLGLDERADLYVWEVPVEYQAVQRLLPVLWKERNPQVLKNSPIFLLCLTWNIRKIQQMVCSVFCE